MRWLVPSTRSSAVSQSIWDTLVVPSGAILRYSSVDTAMWVTLRPMRVCLKPVAALQSSIATETAVSGWRASHCSEEGREELEEDDEISPDEEGFMKGYEEGVKMAKCAKCGKVLGQKFMEKEIKNEIYRFCSDKCAERFKK